MTCRSCGALIWWGITKARKKIPIDNFAAKDGNIRVTKDGSVRIATKAEMTSPDYTGGFVSHFATCPQAKQHRKAAP